MGKTVLEACGISVGYPNKTIFENLSFSVNEGELVGIVGPNGSGKSTLLKSLRSLIPLLGGEVKMLGEGIQTLGDNALARRVAYLQQTVETGFCYTAKEVVLAGRNPYLRWWEKEKARDHEITEKYMKYMGVLSLADTPLERISGGQRQRVLLAKVLTQETPLLFLDEPTTGLDLLYQEEIFRYSAQLSYEGKTILMVVHDLAAAARYCSRLMLLSKDGLIADGSPREVITSEHLTKAYRVGVRVSGNVLTGSFDICALHRQKARGRAHVIGLQSGKILRHLSEAGYRVSVGILPKGDQSGAVAEALDGYAIYTEPFAPIAEEAILKNQRLVEEADIVICMMQEGKTSQGMDAANSAKRLIFIGDKPLDKKEFGAPLRASCDALMLTEEELCRRLVELRRNKEISEEFLFQKDV